MLTVMLPMLAYTLVGAITPGPVNIIATSSAANFGFTRTLPHIVGATLGYTLVVFLAGVGLNQILQAHPVFSQLLKYSGGAFLLYMSYRIATAGAQADDIDRRQATPPTMWQGALVQLLNPKAWLVATSGIALFVSSRAPFGHYLAVFCIVSFAMCITGISTWAAAGHLIHRHLADQRNQRVFNVVMGLILASTIISLFAH